MDEPEGQPSDLRTKAHFWKKVGYTDIYSVRLKATKENIKDLAPGEDGEIVEMIGVPSGVSWPDVLAAIESKYHGVFEVRWFYPLGTVDTLLMTDSPQPIEE